MPKLKITKEHKLIVTKNMKSCECLTQLSNVIDDLEKGHYGEINHNIVPDLNIIYFNMSNIIKEK